MITSIENVFSMNKRMLTQRFFCTWLSSLFSFALSSFSFGDLPMCKVKGLDVCLSVWKHKKTSYNWYCSLMPERRLHVSGFDCFMVQDAQLDFHGNACAFGTIAHNVWLVDKGNFFYFIIALHFFMELCILCFLFCSCT